MFGLLMFRSCSAILPFYIETLKMLIPQLTYDEGLSTLIIVEQRQIFS